MFDKLFGFWSTDMAIDLGTANTLVYVRGKGIVLNEPSVVAVISRNGRNEVLAVGEEAKQMLGRTPGNITAIRPMKDGVIADFIVTEEMIKHFIRKIHKRNAFANPRIIICVPTGSTPVERRAIQEAGYAAGARKVQLIEEPVAAAIGAGLPISEPQASMIVDIGGGTTEVAVISMGGIVTAHSARVAGDELNEAIVAMFRKEFSLDIGENTAEEVKLQLGSAWPLAEELTADVGGRDITTGLPRAQVITSEDVRAALDESVGMIIAAIKTTLERTPPELAADIIGHGLVLSGGGALLAGLCERVTYETGIHAYLAPEPLYSVVLGCGLTLDNIDAMKGLTTQTSFD